MSLGQTWAEHLLPRRSVGAQHGGPLAMTVRAAARGLLCLGIAAGALGVNAGTAAAIECYPHCDYYHYYGPYDFSYKRPGLYAYPVCGPLGNCTPYLVYGLSSAVPSGTIIVTFPRRPRVVPR